MVAVKENKVYTVTEETKDFYVSQGFDILDESGKVIEHGKGKKVSFEDYATLEAENAALKEKCKALEAENVALKEKQTKKSGKEDP